MNNLQEANMRTDDQGSVSSMGRVSKDLYALRHHITPAISRVLHCVILQRPQVTITLATPNTLELALSGVCALVLGQVFTLFKALVAVVTFIRFLPCVNAPVPVQV